MQYSKDQIIRYFEEYFGKKYLYLPYYKMKPLFDFVNKNIPQHFLKLKIYHSPITRDYDTYSMYQGDMVDWSCLPAGEYFISAKCNNTGWIGYILIPDIKFIKIAGNNRGFIQPFGISKKFTFKQPVVILVSGVSAQIKPIKMYDYDYSIPSPKEKPKEKSKPISEKEVTKRTHVNKHIDKSKKMESDKKEISKPIVQTQTNTTILTYSIQKQHTTNQPTTKNKFINDVWLYAILLLIVVLTILVVFR